MKRPKLDDAVRAWGRRPAVTRPDAAARRVVEALPASRRSVGAWAAVALCAGVLGGVAYLGMPSAPRAPESADTSAAHVPQPLPENVVQWWLDARTPVYFVIRPVDAHRGGAP